MSEEVYRVTDKLAVAQSQTKIENSGALAALFQVTSRRSYDEIRRHLIEGGGFQQHVLNGIFPDGKVLPSWYVSIFIYVKNRLITRTEEYFNCATFSEVWKCLGASRGSVGC